MQNRFEIDGYPPEMAFWDESRITGTPIIDPWDLRYEDECPEMITPPELLLADSETTSAPAQVSPSVASDVTNGIIWDEVCTFHPALDFVGDRAYITLGLDTAVGNGTQIVTAPYLICSDGSMNPMNRETLGKLGLRVKKIPSSVPPSPWKKEFLRKFLGGDRSVDVGKLYTDILKALKEFIYFEEADAYHFMALWTMGTYLFPLFPAYPMILLNGPKRSGKSRTLIVSSLLAFNAVRSGDPTSAIIFRLTDELRPTLFFDETEWMSKKDLDSSISEILKFGYKKGFTVSRCMYEGKNPYVEQYETYCPKMFSNIRGAEDVLSDRTIIVTQRRKPEGLAISDIDPSDEQPLWAELRHRLYLFMFSAWRDIRALIPVQNDTPLKDREYEMSAGLLAVARYIEQSGGISGLYETILKMMTRISKERECSDMTSNHDSIVIQALSSLVEQDDWYSVHAVMEEIKKYRAAVNSEWINEEWTGRTLQRLGIGKSPGTKKRAWTIIDGAKKNLTHYFISRSVIEDLANKYDVPCGHTEILTKDDEDWLAGKSN